MIDPLDDGYREARPRARAHAHVGRTPVSGRFPRGIVRAVLGPLVILASILVACEPARALAPRTQVPAAAPAPQAVTVVPIALLWSRYRLEFALSVLLLAAESALIGLLLYERRVRRRTQRRLEERLHVEQLVAEVLAEFANLPAERIDDALEGALERIGRAHVAGQVSLWVISEDRRALERARLWTANGDVPSARVTADVAASLMMTLSGGTPVPGSSAWSKQTAVMAGGDASLVLPLIDGGVTIGALAVGSTRAWRAWSEPVVTGLRVLAQTFATALVRQRSAQAVRASEALSTAVLASMSSNIAILDRTGRIVRVNDAWRRFAVLHGVAERRNAFVGENYIQICRAAAALGLDTPAHIAPRLERLLAGRGDGFALEHTCAGPEGDYWLELRVEPLAHPKGGAVLTYTDITRRKEAERDALSRLHVLAHVSRAITLGALSGSLAHELNQPLTAILSNAQVAARLLSQNPEHGEIPIILDDIVNDTKRASEVIRRLRKLLRAGESEHVAVDVNEIVSNTVRLVADDLIIRRVRLSVELESGLPHVLGDAVQLQQVVLNLLVNALDAVEHVAAADRQITIATGRAAGGIAVRVADHGPGVSAEMLPRMFDPFVTSKSGGLGLGLYINRSIVSAHGGDIRAQANPEGGLAVEVTLPVLVKARSGAAPVVVGLPAS